ncbi:MAG: histidine--tRNA ligase [Candidatus Puniceispirillaceae bacterium]
MDTIQPVRGTSDLLPAEKAKHNYVIEHAKQGAGQFGYADMSTPIFEFTDVFSRPLGASSDVVAKETYSFEDRGGTGLTLRPEGTAAAMRALISNGLTQSLPQRWFYAGPMFRYERPQKGRMRQFHQIGCELIGPASALADAEIIACGVHILKSLGVLEHTNLHLNTLGDTQSRDAYRSALVSYLERYRSALSEDSQRRLDSNPLRILDSKSEADKSILQEAPRLNACLTPAAQAHFETVKQALEAASITWVDDPFLVRGLDYYSHTAFEFITDQLGAQGTVLGGGRYDGLSQTLGGPLLPAVGFAAGIERLALLVDAQPERSPDVVLVAAEQSAEAELFGLGCMVRDAGFSAVSLLSGNMGKKMKAANKLGAKFALIAGADELSRHCVSVRNMLDGTQTEIEISALTSWLAQQV